jgi:hypothetical protein
MSFCRFAAIFFLLAVPVNQGFFAKEKISVPIAEVGGIRITESQMNQAIGSDIYEAESNLYQLKKSWIDQKARTLLFEAAAQKAGLSLADWQRM